jgi:hypothetical protein
MAQVTYFVALPFVAADDGIFHRVGVSAPEYSMPMVRAKLLNHDPHSCA